MKYPRFPWKRNHKCEHPQRMLFYACDSILYPSQNSQTMGENRFLQGFASAWVWYKNSWQRREHIAFTDTAEFWRFTYDHLRQRKPTWCYTYNAGFNATLLRLWNELDTGRQRIFEAGKLLLTRGIGGQNYQGPWRGKTALDGVPFILETRHNKGPIKWVDTLNYWNEYLEGMSQWTGIQLPDNPFGNDNGQMDKQRCELTVEVCEKAILSLMDLWQSQQLGNWQPTIAALAFSSFRHTENSGMIVPHGDVDDEITQRMDAAEITGTDSLLPSEITAAERRAYYGGRTSVFFRGTLRSGFPPGITGQGLLLHDGRDAIHGPITVLDVNSLYAFVMKEYPHPVELNQTFKKPPWPLAVQLIEAFPCVADVEIDSDDYAYPTRIDGNTGYFTGHFATTIGFGELAQAVATNRVRTILNLCVYFHGRPFVKFIDSWYARRSECLKDGRNIEGSFCKLIMNALYGKFAQKTPPWQTCGHVVSPVRWGTFISSPGNGEKPCIMRAIGGVSQYQSTPRNCRHTFVAVAASITSWARMYMQSLIDLCPGRSIVYMDTDSLFCLPPAVSALRNAGLIHPTELGKLKIEGEYQHVKINGMKDYECDGVRTIAGLKSDANEISQRFWEQINYEGVKQILQHDPDGSVWQKMVKFAPSASIPGHSVDWDGWTKPMRID